MADLHPRVSVVIVTYNSGDRLKHTFGSLLKQSMPTDAFEVIFVDDGSTDDTPDYCRALADEHDFVTSERIEHTGWPGRPRNVGIDLARGDYVLFMDHDDDLFPRALERMYGYATKHRADVLLAKEVIKGAATVGWTTWKRNIPVVTTIDQPVLQLLTPHKLYRRQFLVDQAVRFPEGKVRLEDYAFNAQAYVRAERIAVLSSYPCYRWIIHPGNAHIHHFDADRYWVQFRDSLQPALTELPPGPVQDQFLLRWYRGRILRRVGPKFDRYDQRVRDPMVRQITGVMDLFPPRLDRMLAPADRARATLLRAQSTAGLVALARLDTGLGLDVVSLRVRRVEGRLRIRLRAVLANSDGHGTEFHRQPGGRIVRVHPPPLDDLLAANNDDLATALGRATLELSVRGRRSGVEWAVPAEGRAAFVKKGRSQRLEIRLTAEIDPWTAALGRRLSRDTWRVFLRADLLGFPLRRGLVDPNDRDGPSRPLVVPPPLPAFRPGQSRPGKPGAALLDRIRPTLRRLPNGVRRRARRVRHRISGGAGR